ncbi:MAG: hypothetical protein ACI8XM_001125 [Haloarculaceae archaeon]|jgi:hypothetical protein
MSDAVGTPNRRYKVGRVVAEYGLADLHADLPDLWVGADGDPKSLRALADQINVAILQSAMESAGVDPLDGETENAYRLLTDDDVSVGVRTQQRNRLERDGIDVDAIEDDFVTHQAVHTYLTDALGVSKDQTSEDPLEKHEERIQRLRSRTEAVTENSLSELTTAGDLTLGEHNVIVDLQVYCQDCGTQYDIATLLSSGGCDCDS